MLDMKNHVNSQLDVSRNVHDVQGLDKLRQAAQNGDSAALKEAAKQFEAIFVQMMLKSMRKAQDALSDKDSPFNSQQVKFYRDMHDQQLAVDLSTRGNIGIADIIMQQLDPSAHGLLPSDAIRDGANLASLQRIKGAETPGISSDPSLTNGAQNADVNTQSVSQKTEKKPAFASPTDFVKSLMPHVQEFAQQLGVDAKALLAQAAVETGWGKFMIHDGQGNNSHNLFGIKASKSWTGDKNHVDTLEFKNGVPQQEKAAFRHYASFADALQDYVSFVSESPRYQEAVKNAGNPQEYFNALQKAGYATDPNYAKKILSVMDSQTFRDALSFGASVAERNGDPQ